MYKMFFFLWILDVFVFDVVVLFGGGWVCFFGYIGEIDIVWGILSGECDDWCYVRWGVYCR